MNGKAKVREIIDDIKRNQACVDCGEDNPITLTFDHLRDKEFNISSSKSVERLIKELKKCELICANCHLIRSHNRRLADIAKEEKRVNEWYEWLYQEGLDDL